MLLKTQSNKTVIIATNEYEIPKVFQKQLENAIDEMKKLLEKLEHQEDKVYFQKFLQKIPEILEHQEDKVYFQKYCEKINNQLNHFKDFEKKALKISDFSYMINSTFEILSGLALLRTKSFLSIEELNIIDLENTQQDEINLSLDKTKEDLSKWINYCSEITDQFRNFDKDYTNLMNIEDHLFFFEIQEDILIKIDNIKTNLLHNSKEIDKPKVRRLFSSSSTEFLETLSKELSKLEIAKNFEKYELYIKEFYLDYIVEHLTKISCLVNDFCRQIVFERFLKTENYY
ncbi:17153_t:CDS:2 [Gigaspora margarita]|uniref:17153_t:CDS:1 n=1 Tax=Gigaspora margarita TaxID=4874 RepID=A0ABN7VIQ1_GIGMA|nr:17153_t:CDS:2 [Gigaspora margarita]